MRVAEQAWSVRDVMSQDVISTTPATPFKVLVEQLLLDGVSALPVLDVGGRVVGIVSESDLVIKQDRRPGEEALPKAAGRTAAAVMTTPVTTIEPGASIARAAGLMHQRGVNQLPVTDGAGRLLGIVTRGDLLRAFLRTDREIEVDVTEALGRVLANPDTIIVAVRDGVVTLQGEVASGVEVEAAVAAFELLTGVVAVDHRIRALI